MPDSVPTGPWRTRAKWVAWSGLLLAVVLAWRADVFEPRLEWRRDSDRLRTLLEAIGTRGASDYNQADQFRTQIGDERFTRALRKLLRRRPTEFRLSLAERWEKNPLRLSPELHQAVRHRLMQADFELMQPENLAFRELGLVAHLGPAAELLLPELIETVNEPHYSFSGAAALLVLGERAAPAVPAVLEAIRQGRVSRYDDLIPRALLAIDPEGRRSAGELVRLLGSTDSIRIAVLPVLGAQAIYRPELATNHWNLLRSTNREVSMAAIQGLAEARQLTSDRLEEFRGGFHSEIAGEHWLSVMLVASSGSSVAARFVPELIEAADPRSPDSKRALQGLFLVMTGAAAPADRRLSAAEAYLALESSPDRWGALTFLSREGPSAACLLPVVMPMLKDTTPNVRAKAAEVLGQMGPAARAALPQMRALRNDEWKMVREAVEVALPKVGE